MRKPLAHLISFVCNPVFVLLPLPYILVYRSTHSNEYALKWMLFSSAFLAMIGLFIVLGVRRGFFTNLDVSQRTQRPRLFLVTGLFLILYLIGLIYFKAPEILFINIFAMSLGLITITIINFKLKASLHMAIISSFLLTMTILYKSIPIYALILIPIVAWSRITLKRHTLAEVVVGTILGMFLTIATYILTVYIRIFNLPFL